MAQIKFYRGGQNTSLPNTKHDGAIYVKQTGANTGEIWLDLDANTRIKAGGGGANIYSDSSDNWSRVGSTLVSEDGAVYLYIDYEDQEIDGEIVSVSKDIPGIKIGDGSSYLIDLPFLTCTVTTQDREFWNNKVDCYATARDLSDITEDRTLIFTRNYMGPTYVDEIAEGE